MLTLLGPNKEVRINDITFGLPEALFEDVEAWVHEFTEDSIFWPIEEAFDLSGCSRRIRMCVAGVSIHCAIWHILTALHTRSGVGDRLVDSDEFFQAFQSSN